jgi:undecaprenyl-diphosphatase
MAPVATGTEASRGLLRSGSLSLLGFLTLTAIVLQAWLEGVDLAARDLVRQSHAAGLFAFMEGASYWGGQAGQVALLSVGAVVLWPRQRRWAVLLPLVMAGAGALQWLLKWAVDRPRPNLDPLGYPSAHVLSLVVLCGYLAYAASMGRARRRRSLLFGVSAGVVGTVAYSRMYLDAHWLTDVLGGLAAGLAYLLIALWAVRSSPRAVRAWRRASRPGDGDLVLLPAALGPTAESVLAATAAAVTPITPTRRTG